MTARGSPERKFYCDVLGGKIVKADPEGDFVRLGDDFYIGFLYGDVPDESEFLRTARSVWLEIKSDDVEVVTRKILDSGVRKLDVGQVVGHLGMRFRSRATRSRRPSPASSTPTTGGTGLMSPNGFLRWPPPTGTSAS